MNLGVAAFIAALIIGFAICQATVPALAMALLPVDLVVKAFDLPWIWMNPLLPSPADESFWSHTNLIAHVVEDRGIFINATIIGVVIDLGRLAISRLGQKEVAQVPEPLLSTWDRPLVVLFTGLAVVFTLLPYTSYLRKRVLDGAWASARHEPLFAKRGIARRRDTEAFAIGVQEWLDNSALTQEGSIRAEALARALENFAREPPGDSADDSRTEAILSAAFLCTSSHSLFRRAGATNLVPVFVDGTFYSDERIKDFKAFLSRIGPTYTLPSGDGCPKILR